VTANPMIAGPLKILLRLPMLIKYAFALSFKLLFICPYQKIITAQATLKAIYIIFYTNLSDSTIGDTKLIVK
jgi:hypothetical protein